MFQSFYLRFRFYFYLFLTLILPNRASKCNLARSNSVFLQFLSHFRGGTSRREVRMVSSWSIHLPFKLSLELDNCKEYLHRICHIYIYKIFNILDSNIKFYIYLK